MQNFAPLIPLWDPLGLISGWLHLHSFHLQLAAFPAVDICTHFAFIFEHSVFALLFCLVLILPFCSFDALNFHIFLCMIMLHFCFLFIYWCMFFEKHPSFPHNHFPDNQFPFSPPWFMQLVFVLVCVLYVFLLLAFAPSDLCIFEHFFHFVHIFSKMGPTILIQHPLEEEERLRHSWKCP